MRVIARMNVGGPARQVDALLRGLDPDRFEQRLYTGAVGAGERELCAPDLAVHRVPGLGRRVRVDDDARALAGLVAEMRRFRPHIVHTHTAKAGALGRVAAALARVPVRVHTFHGHLLHGYFSPGRTAAVVRAERLLARGCERLVAVGGQVRDDLLAAGIGRPSQFAVVPPGTTLPPLPDRRTARDRLGLPQDGPVVTYVGRVTAVKRPDRLLAVARLVHAVRPDVTFVICGGGDRLDVLAPAAGPDGPIRLAGWRADVETVHAAADLTLLTSDNEGMPVSLIEAGLAGVPAVAADVGSVAEVVQHGVTGLLAAPDPQPLAHHVLRLLGNEPLRHGMGRAARAVCAQRFSAQRLVADIDAIYTAIADARGWPARPRLVEEHCG